MSAAAAAYYQDVLRCIKVYCSKEMKLRNLHRLCPFENYGISCQMIYHEFLVQSLVYLLNCSFIRNTVVHCIFSRSTVLHCIFLNLAVYYLLYLQQEYSTALYLSESYCIFIRNTVLSFISINLTAPYSISLVHSWSYD